MRKNRLFAVSLIAVMMGTAAHADIASTKYVDDAVSPVSTAASNAASAASTANTAATNAQKAADDAAAAAAAAQQTADGKQDKSTAVTHTANTAVGSATLPVYVDTKGVATAITSYSGNAASATKATQDGSGRNIVNTYATKTDLNGKQATLTTGTGGNLQGAGNVTVSKAENGTITITGNVDAELSATSTNPVQNNVVNTAITAANTAATNAKTAADNAAAAAATAQQTADGKQAKSSAAYQMGGANGTWTTMSTAQQNALNSGITSGKVSTYDGYATTIGNKQDKSTAVTHTANTAVGDSTHPVYITTAGVATKIDKVAAAATADKATQDGNGRNIVATYATKTELADSEYTLPAATASALGGVKSGGDITVAADGAVTVTHANTAGTATSATSATKATQDGNGKVIADTYATKTELADSAYTLPAATASALGGVKSGGNITVAADGTVTVNNAAKANTATSATSATKATQDGNGNNIVNTYATKNSVIPVPTETNATGTLVLTYNTTTKTYAWESIDRTYTAPANQ